ncbi:hypothetical protein KM176_23735 [Pseudooceanicola sp. CBS1P-1]|uniref:Uncharacterized protein n=1 Tax=Pseudooceanicola albus TaxID=2692189 RepID=A0A6L7GAK7_9RHOB|nr:MULTISPECIES: hypothetical protein [Pseudooceanicola]MBT9386875.1 hypothetical protein [Pseudooceanicola endophyticus]MXN20989.1 hypothetical protein [Pseudooceanicola albus]
MQSHDRWRPLALLIRPMSDGALASLAAVATWEISGLDDKGETTFVFAKHRCGAAAGAELASLFLAAGATCTLVYRDATETVSATGADAFADRLAEVMWDDIEASEDQTDPPDARAACADGHPVDDLRFGFLEAARLI